jgi:hypothetical protein
MKLIKYSILLFIGLFFLSCSKDNPVDNNQTFANYLPVTVGSYWIYDTYTLDSNSQRTSLVPQIDSTIVTGTIVKLGYEGSIFTSYTIDSGRVSTGTDVFYRSDSSKIWVYTNIITNMLPPQMPIQINEQWMLLANPNDDDWKIMEQNFENLQILPGTSFNGNHTVWGSKVGPSTVQIGTKQFQTIKYLMKITFSGTMTTIGGDIPINFTRNTYLYFAEDIGLIKMFMEPLKFSIFTFSMNLPGEDRTLTKFFIH